MDAEMRMAELLPLKVKKMWVLRPFQEYSQLSLSRLRLSRITAYLEEKIWSLFQHRNLTSGNKMLWIREEIAYFSPFPHYFKHTFLIKGVKLHVPLWNSVVWLVFSSFLQIWYVEVRISRSVSEGPFDFEITRVDCISLISSRSSVRGGRKPECPEKNHLTYQCRIWHLTCIRTRLEPQRWEIKCLRVSALNHWTTEAHLPWKYAHSS